MILIMLDDLQSSCHLGKLGVINITFTLCSTKYGASYTLRTAQQIISIYFHQTLQTKNYNCHWLQLVKSVPRTSRSWLLWLVREGHIILSLLTKSDNVFKQEFAHSLSEDLSQGVYFMDHHQKKTFGLWESGWQMKICLVLKGLVFKVWWSQRVCFLVQAKSIWSDSWTFLDHAKYGKTLKLDPSRLPKVQLDP